MSVDDYIAGWNAAKDGKPHVEPVSMSWTEGYQAWNETERVMKETGNRK